jgi:hypothetical protein
VTEIPGPAGLTNPTGQTIDGLIYLWKKDDSPVLPEKKQLTFGEDDSQPVPQP